MVTPARAPFRAPRAAAALAIALAAGAAAALPASAGDAAARASSSRAERGVDEDAGDGARNPDGAALWPTPRDIATIRDMGGLALSPDEQQIAFLVRAPDPDRDHDALVWMVADIANATTRIVADGGALHRVRMADGAVMGWAWDRAAHWSPDGAHIAFPKTLAGREEVWRAPATGLGEAMRLAGADADVLAFRWTPDSKAVLYHRGAARAGRDAARRAQRRAGALYGETVSPGNIPEPWQPAAAPERPAGLDDIAFARGPGADFEIWRADARSDRRGRDREAALYRRRLGLDDAGDAADGASSRVAHAGGAEAWLAPIGPARFNPEQQLYVRRSEQSATVACPDSRCRGRSIDRLMLSPDGAYIAFLRRDDAFFEPGHLIVWRPGETQARRLGADLGRLSGCVAGRRALFCVAAAPTSPPRLVEIDAVTGAARPLYDPNAAFRAHPLPRVERFEWRLEDGGVGVAHLIHPPTVDGARAPLIVACYTTGGFLKGGEGDYLPLFALAARGFLVMECAFDDRLLQAAWRDSTDAADYARRLQTDPAEKTARLDAIEQGVAALVARGDADPARVAITGFSMGAYAAAQALIERDVAAVGLLATPTPGEATIFAIAPPAVQQRHIAGGRGPGSGAFNRHSLAAQAARVRAPVQIHAPGSEAVTAISDINGLLRAGVAAELYLYPDEYHLFEGPAARLARYERGLDWLAFWLLGDEDSAPGKEEQYRRWRAMRDARARAPAP